MKCVMEPKFDLVLFEWCVAKLTEIVISMRYGPNNKGSCKEFSVTYLCQFCMMAVIMGVVIQRLRCGQC